MKKSIMKPSAISGRPRSPTGAPSLRPHWGRLGGGAGGAKTLFRLGSAAILLVGVLSAVPLWGSASGQQLVCTSCHTPNSGSAPQVMVMDPAAPASPTPPSLAYVLGGKTNVIALRVRRTHASHTAAGFWMQVSAGSLSVSEPGISASGTSANHTMRHVMGADTNEASDEVRFELNYTAPNSGTSVTFSGWANAVNQDGNLTSDYPLAIPNQAVPVCYDADGDGYFDPAKSHSSCQRSGWDCDDGLSNDTGADEHPGRAEVCDNEDNDCDGTIDEGCDDDNDDFCDAQMNKDAGVTVSLCNKTLATATQGDDCNDSAASGGNVYWNAPEICDNKDNDCDGTTDEDCDKDGDGYCDSSKSKQAGLTVTVCNKTPANLSKGDDCNDNASGGGTVNPGRPESCNNLDDNCSGTSDEGCDDDGDDYCDDAMALTASTTCPQGGGDCMDAAGFGSVNPGAAELCDGLDNDCDGETDNEIKSLTCGLGECQRAAAACVNGEPQSCTPGPTAPETCANVGKDNDCDGSANELEDNIYEGDTCSIRGAAGICSVGMYACSDANLICQAPPPEAEHCGNVGIDNDCDGNAHELEDGVFLGDACSVAEGVGICTTGRYACSGKSLICQPDFKPGQVAETCTNIGVDNDCDGDSTEIADGVHAGDACDTNLYGICADGTNSCSSGTLICIETILAGTQSEICDGLDNDCDGGVDNKPELGCGIGACFRAVPACLDGAENTCTPLEPKDELCDNEDNDCDGDVDEGCDDDNDGYCDADMQFSVASSRCPLGQGDCDDQYARTYPGAPERCDGKDNDCNGDEDDDVTIFSCGVGQCEGEGTGCEDGVATDCATKNPTPEICDGLDNDCDGINDNDLKAAQCGLGQCAATGSSCFADSCEPLAVQAPEICDGLDNDCDGIADETDELPAAECGVGSCRRTGSSCDPSSCSPGTPFIEICDGEDNDCNGVVDDGLPSSTCGLGECAAIGGSCLPASCVPGTPSAELCDGLDNDCDGVIDNGCDDDNDGYCDSRLEFVNAATCDQGPGDCDDASADTRPGAPELCDGLDNDCDDEVDEDIPEGSVFCGRGACVAPGKECVDGQATECTPGMPSKELCDGLDNDCDGTIDENLGELSCGVGQCRVSMAACHRGQAGECAPLAPSDEVCDGLDNDCNGEIDEDAPCDQGVCLAGRCLVVDRGQGGASGLVDYTGLSDDPNQWLSGLGGAGSALPPQKPKEPRDDDSKDPDMDSEVDDERAPNDRSGCALSSRTGSPAEHSLWYFILSVAVFWFRRRRHA